MAGNKYISIDGSGDQLEVAATQTSAGSGDAGKIPALNSAGQIDPTMLPNLDSTTILASETIAAGNIVNVYDNSGTRNVRKADGSSYAKRAVGFVNAGITSGASGTVNFEGTVTGLTGLTAGVEYYLSNVTPGAITATPVTTSGHILQVVGTALSATELTFEPERPVIRA